MFFTLPNVRGEQLHFKQTFESSNWIDNWYSLKLKTFWGVLTKGVFFVSMFLMAFSGCTHVFGQFPFTGANETETFC